MKSGWARLRKICGPRFSRLTLRRSSRALTASFALVVPTSAAPPDKGDGSVSVNAVYDPRAERWGNYVPTVVPRRYDAFINIDESHAVDALHFPALVDGEVPETYPSGM